MKKYKIIGITNYAINHLSLEDLEYLRDVIGCEVVECKYKSRVDGKTMLEMPDGVRTHVDFLKLEEVQPEFNFPNNDRI